MRQLRKAAREIAWLLRFWFLRHGRGVDLDRTVRVGRSVTFDRSHPRGIHIGRNTYITNDVTILTHDHARSKWDMHTVIGERCFIGNGAIILPGVTIGDEVIIGAGSVVTRDVPSHSIAAGNPARVIRSGIRMSDDARLIPDAEGDTGGTMHVPADKGCRPAKSV